MSATIITMTPTKLAATFANIEAEQQLLGAILLNNATLDLVSDILTADHFADPVHARIYTAASRRIAAQHLVSPVTMRVDMEGDEGLASLGGPAYLARIAGAAIYPAGARDYAKMIIDAAARRALTAGATAAIEALAEGVDLDEARLRLSAVIDALPEGAGDASSYSLQAAVVDAVQRAADAYQGGVPFLKTGIPALDGIVRGLAPGDMCLIAGATSMGKTSLALDIAANVARSGKGVAFVSLEMTRQELASRLVSAEARVAYTDLRDPAQMNEAEFRKWVEASQPVADLPIRIIPRHVRDIPAIHSAVRRASRDLRGGLGLLVVDYAQLIRAPGKDRYTQMTEVSIGIKQMAGMLEVPVIALCQLSREIGKRDDRRPQLSDIKETGQFENDADQVVFCHREAYWLTRDGPKLDMKGDVTPQARIDWLADIAGCENTMELIVRKNRHGRLATAEVGFHAPTNRFWDVERH